MCVYSIYIYTQMPDNLLWSEVSEMIFVFLSTSDLNYMPYFLGRLCMIYICILYVIYNICNIYM